MPIQRRWPREQQGVPGAAAENDHVIDDVADDVTESSRGGRRRHSSRRFPLTDVVKFAPSGAIMLNLTKLIFHYFKTDTESFPNTYGLW